MTNAPNASSLISVEKWRASSLPPGISLRPYKETGPHVATLRALHSALRDRRGGDDANRATFQIADLPPDDLLAAPVMVIMTIDNDKYRAVMRRR